MGLEVEERGMPCLLSTTTKSDGKLIMSEEQPRSARTEILPADQKRSLSTPRCASQHSLGPTVTPCCADCKLPLLIEGDSREKSTKSRVGSTLKTDQFCRECAEEKGKNTPKSPSRLVNSPVMNWSNMSSDIETWFEKAPTRDQRVVYNFLEQINNKSNEQSSTKYLDDILNNLKKYQTHFNTTRPPNKFTRVVESSTWRVMRPPIRSTQGSCDNQAENNAHDRSIFTTAGRKMGSTFLIHPSWI